MDELTALLSVHDTYSHCLSIRLKNYTSVATVVFSNY